MKTVSKVEASSTLREFLRAAKKEAIKIEVLQDYSAIDDSPSLQAWKRGQYDQSKKLLAKMPRAWHEDYGQLKIKKTRIHVVEYPLTPYLEWEIEVYKFLCIPIAGEEVYLVKKNKDLELPDGDFWIIDQSKLVKFNYEDGNTVSGEISQSPDEIAPYLRCGLELLKSAEPVK